MTLPEHMTKVQSQCSLVVRVIRRDVCPYSLQRGTSGADLFKYV